MFERITARLLSRKTSPPVRSKPAQADAIPRSGGQEPVPVPVPQSAIIEREPEDDIINPEPQEFTYRQEPRHAFVEHEPEPRHAHVISEPKPGNFLIESEPRHVLPRPGPQHIVVEPKPRRVTFDPKPRHFVSGKKPRSFAREPQSLDAVNVFDFHDQDAISELLEGIPEPQKPSKDVPKLRDVVDLPKVEPVPQNTVLEQREVDPMAQNVVSELQEAAPKPPTPIVVPESQIAAPVPQSTVLEQREIDPMALEPLVSVPVEPQEIAPGPPIAIVAPEPQTTTTTTTLEPRNAAPEPTSPPSEPKNTNNELQDILLKLDNLVLEPTSSLAELRKVVLKAQKDSLNVEDIAAELRRVLPKSHDNLGLLEAISKYQHVPAESQPQTAQRNIISRPRMTAIDADRLFQHPDWDDRADEEFDLNVASASTDSWKRWTVKLEFTQKGSKRTGSAFYINLDQKSGRILLTAGHNLISKEGEMVQDMKIADTGEKIDPNWMFVSDEYKSKPGEDSKIHDYGMILLPGNPDGGFGFSLKIAEARGCDLKLPGVNITGYQQGKAEPDFHSGKVGRVMGKCIKYSIQSISGNSGGPVWVGNAGKETAIGIHNYGPGDSKKGSNPVSSMAQGTRIHLGVLQDICRWTATAKCNVGYLSKRLAVFKLKPPHDNYNDPERTFFLKFTKGVTTAKARLGAEDLETTFDVVPGLTASWAAKANGTSGTQAPPNAKYVFMFKEWKNWQEDTDDEDSGSPEKQVEFSDATPKPQWLRWRTDKDINRVELSESLRDDSFVVLQKKLQGFEIVAEAQASSETTGFAPGQRKLRMMVDDVDVMPPDGAEGLYELYESEQVGFIRAEAQHTKNLYCVFKFM
ncbi:hypothetical protein TWF718_005459 [Orbilia javanica]|uniref:Serine protease n=1 Tax=Orbilia javanica TaxID=47235 RepID=A0AAN8RDK0_9PEZI